MTPAKYNFTLKQGETFTRVIYAATPNRSVSDASIAAGSTTLSSTKANFSAGDVGKLVFLEGAGAENNPLVAYITAYAAPNVTLDNAAFIAVTNAVLVIKTPINFTGYTAKMQLRAHWNASTALLSLTNSANAFGSGISLSTDGKITITIDDQDSALLTIPRAVYDLAITQPAITTTEYYIEGAVNILRRATS